MKLKYIVPVLVLTLAACKPGNNENSTIQQKIRQRDSIALAIEDLKSKLAEINSEIAMLDTTAASRKAVFVMTEKLEKDSFNHYFQVQGVVEADKNILISPEVAGMVKQVLVKEGQEVAKGQTLLVMDTELIQRSIDEMQSSLALAEEIYRRQENLWNQKIGTEIQYLEARTRKESLEKSVKTLQAQLAKAVVKAPESGTVDEIFIKAGELAGPQMPVARVVNTDDVYITSDVSEKYLTKVKKGQEVLVELPSLNMSMTGKITAAGNYINPGNRTFKVTVGIQNKDGLLKPNLLAVINIKDFEGKDVITVPADHLVADSDGGQFIFVAEKSGQGKAVARKVPVKTGRTYRGRTVIEGGLTGTEEMITEGSRAVTNGESIIIKN
jgi:membrane fusion protein, multidrug efflux system